MAAGAQLEWILRKGDYSGTSAVVVDLGPTRVEQIGTKNLNRFSQEADYETAQTDTMYPFEWLIDFSRTQKTFRLTGDIVNSGTDYAYDKKNKIISMFDSARTGSLHIVQFSQASGTNTGSESWVVNFLNYNFTHDSAGVDRVKHTIMLVAGSEMV